MMGVYQNVSASCGYGRWGRIVKALAVICIVLATGQAHAKSAKLLILGDSLTAGYGLAAAQSFPAQLQERITAEGFDVQVINGGVSGDTTAGGLARLDWMLADRPSYAMVELGANDGLRGLDPDQTFANLDAILGRLKKENIAVLLTGMMAPPNLGREYGDAFNGLYKRLAEKHQVLLYPFFLEGVAAEPGLNQRDGIHPNAEGVAVIVDAIWPSVEGLLTLKD